MRLARAVRLLQPLLRVGAATAAAALLGWLALVAVARLLGADQYAEFSVLWGFYFTLAGLLFGLQQEVTRSVGHREHTLAGHSDHAGTVPLDVDSGAPVMSGVAVITGVMTVALVASSPLWAEKLFGSQPWATLVAVVVGVVTLAVQATIMGVVAARRQLGIFSGMVTVAAVVRLVVIVGVCQTTASAAGLMWGIASGSAIWLLFLPSARVRHAMTAVGDAHTKAFIGRATTTIIASACAALLATGFPFMVRATSDGELGADAGVLFAAVLATRAPLLLPLTGFQLVIISYFVRHRAHLARAIPSVVGGILALGVVGAALATAVGPWLLKLLFGDDFVIGGAELGLLTFAASLLVLLTVTGLALLAFERHGSFMAGWLAATAVTLAVLVVLEAHADLTERSVVALLAGPAVGAALHLLLLVTGPHDRASVDPVPITPAG
jgi:O-antigen/teichoic acid export membrane protein